jgi:hypothetical protein
MELCIAFCIAGVGIEFFVMCILEMINGDFLTFTLKKIRGAIK